jgi:DNA-binding transcriptional LysR family regulator
MDLLNKMATYVRVVDSGSFAAAAKQLRVSSAAVSRQIAALEVELRAPLITRSTRRMAITAEGRRYYERCVRILREVDDAQQVGRADDLGGMLRITAPVTFGLACVAPQMGTLMQKYPGLVVELLLEDRLADLAPEGFDIAIRVGTSPPASTELVATKLVTFRRLLVASPQYLKRHGEPKRPEALVRHDTLMHFMGQTDTWTLQRTREEAEVRVRPRVAFRCNALHALRELAIEGAGIALLPEWFVANPVAAGKLRLVLPAWHQSEVTANAIHRRDQRGAVRVKAVIDHMRRGLLATMGTP